MSKHFTLYGNVCLASSDLCLSNDEGHNRVDCDKFCPSPSSCESLTILKATRTSS